MQRVRKQLSCPDFAECSSGEPVTVAFMDTGVRKHPDLSGRIIAFKDFVNGKPEAYDDSGHGTHVCGIAAGNGILSWGKYCGIAPQNYIVMAKELAKMIEEACDEGILLIYAAGNLGPKPGCISSLGLSRRVVTVGCNDGEFFKDYINKCETFSGRGPGCDIIKKPDIVAPGTRIIACNAFYYKNREIL